MSKRPATPLTDPEVEKALLGACMLSDGAIEDAQRYVTAADFTGVNAELWDAIVDAAKVGPVDPITVAAQRPDNEAIKKAASEAIYVTPTISAAGHYARQVADLAVRRRMVWASNDIAELASTLDGTSDAGEVLDKSRALLADIDVPISQGPPDQDIDSFMRSVDDQYDWLIPGFLERRDRLLVTAGEGSGKSILLAQIAVQAASGIHPWTLAEVPPRNVLYIDLENGSRMVGRRMNMLRKHAPKMNPQRLRVHVRPDGINLMNRSDRMWLLDRCQANAAELLVIGPIYRMSAGVSVRGDIGGEDQARTVTKALDEVRNRANVALIAETHAPHGDGFGRDLRPFGSSLWLRWPEFGIGIRRSDRENNTDFDLLHWRGPRDKREWPEQLIRSNRSWPWMPSGMPTGTFNTARRTQ